ncbi:MAG: CoA pyrophosphatase [Bacteroidetes bacterium]|nr:CoA pyrophosphatase [Bacteroidota bacterium]
MIFSEFIYKLEKRLQNPLPGKKAQLLMGSDIRMKDFVFKQKDDKSKKSGVMILLYPYNDCVYSTFIKRTEYNGTHSGQIALPGGKYETCDKNLIDTALRETSEEIGIDSSKIKILGQLSELFIPPSNYIIYPSVGYLNSKPFFIPEKREVEKIIEYNIFDLLKEATIKTKEFKIFTGLTFNAPYFDINNHVVWGATAMIMSEFVEILKEICN